MLRNSGFLEGVDENEESVYRNYVSKNIFRFASKIFRAGACIEQSVVPTIESKPWMDKRKAILKYGATIARGGDRFALGYRQ